ncbi:monovalent cation:proton antiporter-2 (CPA2) family protein [Methylophaga sp. OBS4]|uniref:monovalent cation:proton antiporter-2 (CPA2) family protein n=1 Tax=Methylophaga sp. OBS4 TaxID=2991935 RepID=UPI0022501E95|nr:monovalent cation:proton antiporter-2 (CPA2) family protein [Methylophaga sp. OBS4]MCX4187987.1 monovalent cation:proton antiporter-2 (CPA2) family protein [Methylophaga sp. OBS4]
MQEAGGYLIDILALLLATVVIIPFFHAIRLGAILGYLTAGVILGPWGFGVITEVEDIRHLAEFGVVFLLFILGIELKPDKLWQMRRMVIGLGMGQVFITAGLIYGLALWFGVSQKSAIIVGFGLALSSTAFCLKLLSERGGISTVMGRMSFSILLLQDLAVVPLLALVSYFASGGDPAAMEVGLKPIYAVLMIIALLVAGRYLLNPVMGRIVASQDPEVFIALSVLLVLGVAWIMESVGFSMALGAFLAGVMLAESHYRHQIEADILPFRGILLGLFFMTVGMGINFALLWEHLFTIIALTLGLMILKALVVYLLSRLTGARHDISLQTGVLLSQSGEFGFVLFGFAAASGVLESSLSHILTLVIALTMVLTPFVVKGTNMLLLRFYIPEPDDEDYAEFVDHSEEHVILAGFGRVGARVGTLLGAAGVPYIALDMKQQRVKEARAQGFPVFFGDASKVKVLQSAGADHAKMIVVTLDEPNQVDRLVTQVRQFYPNMPIHTRARDRKHCAELISQGATTTVSETLETSLRLTEEVLLGSGVEEAVAKNVINEFRDDYYSNVVQKVTENKVVLGELKH